MQLRSRTSCTGALQIHHFHRVQRPTVPEEVEGISTKIFLLYHPALGLFTIRSSMARRNRSTVHSLLVLLPALSVLRISHTYRLLISQLAVSTSQATSVNFTRHLRLTPPINLLLHRPDHSSSGMAIAFLRRLDRIRDCNTRVLLQIYRIDSSHSLLYRLPNLHLPDLPTRRPLLRHHLFRRVEMHSHRMLAQHSRNLTPRGSQHLEIQGKGLLVVRLPCIINYLLYRTILQTVALAYHLQLSIVGLLV